MRKKPDQTTVRDSEGILAEPEMCQLPAEKAKIVHLNCPNCDEQAALSGYNSTGMLMCRFCGYSELRG